MRYDPELPSVAQIMHTPVISVGEDEDLLHAARQLAAHGWSGAPVVDEKGVLTGIITLSDITRAYREKRR